MGLRSGGDSLDWFLAAMAHCRLGHKEAARQWYARGLAVSGDDAAPSDGLRELRAEAEELLANPQD
jgi:hypothetical protein